MRSLQPVRAGLLVTGLSLGLFGTWSLLRLGVVNLFWALLWLGGGIFAHDALLAGATVLLVAVGMVVLPRWARAPVAAGFVVLGSVTVMAIPVLGRFGALPDNPSLLDRSYGVGWLVLAGIVALGVIAATAVTHRREAARMDDEHG
jgi:hypothetical protein